MSLLSNLISINQRGVGSAQWDQLLFILQWNTHHHHLLSFIHGGGNLLLTQVWLNTLSCCQPSWNNKPCTANDTVIKNGNAQKRHKAKKSSICTENCKLWLQQSVWTYYETSIWIDGNITFLPTLSFIFSSTGPVFSERLRHHMAACCCSCSYNWDKAAGQPLLPLTLKKHNKETLMVLYSSCY